MVNNKFNLTQKETARLIELIIKGSDAMEDNLDDALEFIALINNAGISDVEKAAKAEIIRHPELEVTLHDVTIKTVPDAKFELDIVAVNRDENMKAIYEATLQKKRDDVTVTASDMNLRSRSAKDMKFLKPVHSTAWKMKIEKAKKA